MDGWLDDWRNGRLGDESNGWMDGHTDCRTDETSDDLLKLMNGCNWKKAV